MTAIPSENMAHIRSIAREILHESARPDFRPSNRWYHIELDEYEDRYSDEIASACREAGYKVSTLPKEVKVTKPGLHWPDVE
ncbi:hypothetical protein [Natrinema sp. DC36]|uniref:hypothetical protein n=1 Tax=Natrinema sp. DC36 TaxID=2878680 RepID=UPI001CF0894D|nr:hypothetical protein [Natrinema sp. DC36]